MSRTATKKRENATMKLTKITAALLCLGVFAGCDDDLVKDSGFDLWCRESLCRWRTEEGSVARVPTWHRRDYGVRLVDTPTTISQVVDMQRAQCLRFKIIADVTAEAQVALEFDFFADGVVDHSESIPGVRWQSQELLVKLPVAPVDLLRLALHKKGPGAAIFAELSADFVDNCYGDPIHLAPRPNGTRCSADDECSSGRCVGDGAASEGFDLRQRCGDCEADADCGAGEVCGVGRRNAAQVELFRACVAEGSTEAAAECLTGAECASGFCAPPVFWGNIPFGLVCGGCAESSDCATGEVCGVSQDAKGAAYRECAPSGRKSVGDVCVLSDECADSVCCIGRCSQVSTGCPG